MKKQNVVGQVLESQKYLSVNLSLSKLKNIKFVEKYEKIALFNCFSTNIYQEAKFEAILSLGPNTKLRSQIVFQRSKFEKSGPDRAQVGTLKVIFFDNTFRCRIAQNGLPIGCDLHRFRYSFTQLTIHNECASSLIR